MIKQFIPFNKIDSQEVIVVDGLHPDNLVLSHWKGANTLQEIEADTSGEIVINAIKKGINGIDCPKISATHFDIDGFVGVFALFESELALEYQEELIAMAKIGDFREFNPQSLADIHALKLCCWMNRLEKEKFYKPFEEKDEIEQCVQKFEFFLPIFKEVLINPDSFKIIWKDEFQKVMDGLKEIVSTKDYRDIGLIRKRVKSPINYYALFSKTEDYDIVLSIYDNNKYELEFKYTTWVDIASRKSLPRIDLTALVNTLNSMEKSNFEWGCDKITDTGPILRLEKISLTKAERYANPYDREIYSSSINEEDFEVVIVEYLKEKYRDIKAKRFWTWNEMRSLNSIKLDS